MSVAIVGSTVRDVVYLPGREPTHSPGGSPIFAARALAALGVRPGVATRCDDAALAAPIAELAEPFCLRIDATVMQSELRYREDGERDHTLASIGVAWSAEDIATWAAPALEGATWIHAGTQRGGDLGPEVLAALADGGRSRRARCTGAAATAAGRAARAERHAGRRAARGTCRRSS